MPQHYEIPLKPTPQRFSITLSGTEYRLTLQYRMGWYLDIAQVDGTPLVNGIPLVTGINLLEQHEYLNLGGRLWVQGAGDPDNVPTFDDLGVGSKLYWVTD